MPSLKAKIMRELLQMPLRYVQTMVHRGEHMTSDEAAFISETLNPNLVCRRCSTGNTSTTLVSSPVHQPRPYSTLCERTSSHSGAVCHWPVNVPCSHRMIRELSASLFHKQNLMTTYCCRLCIHHTKQKILPSSHLAGPSISASYRTL